MMVIHTLASHLLPDAAPDSWLIAQQMLLMLFPSLYFVFLSSMEVPLKNAKVLQPL